MHVPDGFLDTKTIIASAAIASAGVGVAVARARKTLPPSKIPVLGLSAAFLFAAQMINFPIAGGTSGHLVGSVLVAAILGPAGAVIVLVAVLLVQALLFADGGLLALGANVVNMALVAPLIGFGIYRMLAGTSGGARRMLVAAGGAAWISIVGAAAVCSGELAWSGMAPWGVIFPAMVGVHAVIGIGEAIITVIVLAALLRVRPDLMHGGSAEPQGKGRSGLLLGGTVAIAVLLFIVPFASPWPDGLEHVASRLGFSSRALSEPKVPSPLAGYNVTGLQSPAAAAGIAGAVGAGVTLAVSLVLARVLAPRSSKLS